MKIKAIRFLKIVVSIAVTILLSGCPEKLEADLIIKNVTIVDVENGLVKPAMDLAVSGDRIAAILPHKSDRQYPTGQVIDGSGKYLIPGLWDMHTHTWWAYKDFFPLLIANGVTGIREMFGSLENIKQIRAEIAAGEIPGPEIYSAGAIVDGDPAIWPGSDVAGSPEAGREYVRKQMAEGADFIKVYSLLDRQTYFAIADESKKQRIPFAGHIPAKVTIEEAVAAGQHTIEHAIGLLEYCSDKKDHYFAVMRGEKHDSLLSGRWAYMRRQKFIVDSFDAQKVADLAALLTDSNTWLCPTNTVNRSFAEMNDPEFRKDERTAYMPAVAMRGWDPTQDFRLRWRTEADYQISKDRYQLILSNTKILHDAGVKFLAGTDYPNPFCFPGFSLHDELQIFVDAGLSPLAALQTATLNPALFLQRNDDFGSVESGKIANLLLLNANPLDNIANTREIAAVVLRGRYHAGSALREKIEAIATRNSLPNIADEIYPLIGEQGIEAAIDHYRNLKQNRPGDFNFNQEQLNMLGYRLLNEKQQDIAIAIFQLNVEMFPRYGNGFDSLGDAFSAAGDTVRAIEAYRKAVELGMGEISGTKIKKLGGGD